jgi:CO dehydrogenase/acetyl-CoA synthase beta subunit
MVGEDMKGLFARMGMDDLFDKIADETISTSPSEIRNFLESKAHPALSMDDMALYAEMESVSYEPADVAVEAEIQQTTAQQSAAAARAESVTDAIVKQAVDVDALKHEIISELRSELKKEVTREVVSEIIGVLEEQFLGAKRHDVHEEKPIESQQEKTAFPETRDGATSHPKASERLSGLTSFSILKEKYAGVVHRVKIGATKAQGGTRKKTYEIGGANTMPFHHWEGAMPNRPLVAMEVFDRVNEKYPNVLRDVWGGLIGDPAAMAKACVETFGADLISVRLDGTHPERGAY